MADSQRILFLNISDSFKIETKNKIPDVIKFIF
jgi:hypothetical protein